MAAGVRKKNVNNVGVKNPNNTYRLPVPSYLYTSHT